MRCTHAPYVTGVEDLPDIFLHAEERGWVSSLDGYYARPRPILTPVNSSFAASTAPPSSLAPFLLTPQGDIEKSVWTGTKDEVLQYARVLQLLAAVKAGHEVDELQNATSAVWSVMVPRKVRITPGDSDEVVQRDFSRVVNIE